jgi:hypothetical protein
MTTSFVIHYLGLQARNRSWGHLSEMVTISSSGLTPRNASNGTPRL